MTKSRPYTLNKIDKQTMKKINKKPQWGDIEPNLFNVGIDVFNYELKASYKK